MLFSSVPPVAFLALANIWTAAGQSKRKRLVWDCLRIYRHNIQRKLSLRARPRFDSGGFDSSKMVGFGK